jgi:hypothetical protein
MLMADDKTPVPSLVNKTVEELRRTFTPMTERLTMETEMAVVYTPAAPLPAENEKK